VPEALQGCALRKNPSLIEVNEFSFALFERSVSRQGRFNKAMILCAFQALVKW
jgi:hypothetical protein